MPKLRLTRKAIDALPNPKSGQVFHRDSELRGFGVCGRDKSFFVERQTNGRTRRVTLGRVTDLSVEAARARAMETLAALGRGEDPVAERRASRSTVPTVREAFASFFAGKPNLAGATVANYGRTK